MLILYHKLPKRFHLTVAVYMKKHVPHVGFCNRLRRINQLRNIKKFHVLQLLSIFHTDGDTYLVKKRFIMSEAITLEIYDVCK